MSAENTTLFRRGDEVRVEGWACTSLVVGVEVGGNDTPMVWVLNAKRDHGCYGPCVWMHPHELQLVEARGPR
jgi:hypothetical protein